jgi:hypothetical protein
MAQDLIAFPAPEPGTFPDALVREHRLPNGQKRWEINDPRIILVREAAENLGATWHDQRRSALLRVNGPKDQDAALSKICQMVESIPSFEIDRNLSRFAGDELFKANFPYVYRPRYTNAENLGSQKIFVAPSMERYEQGMEIARKADRGYVDDHLPQIQKALGSGVLSESRLVELTGIAPEEIMEGAPTLTSAQTTQLLHEFMPANDKSRDDIREFIDKRRLTSNNAGRDISEAALATLTQSEAYALIKHSKSLSSPQQRAQLLALAEQGYVREREVSDVDKVPYRKASSLIKDALNYLNPDEQEQINKMESYSPRARAEKDGAYYSKPITQGEREHNSLMFMQELVAEKYPKSTEMKLGDRKTYALQAISGTPYHILAVNGDGSQYALLNRGSNARYRESVLQAIETSEWDSTPPRPGEARRPAENALAGAIITFRPNDKGEVFIDLSPHESIKATLCEAEAQALMRSHGIDPQRADLSKSEKLTGSVFGNNDEFHTIVDTVNKTFATVPSLQLEDPSASFMQQATWVKPGMTATNGNGKAAKQQVGAGRSH